MRLIRLALIMVAGTFIAPVVLSQESGYEKHRDELLVPIKGVSVEDPRDGRRFFEAARNYWHGENGSVRNRAKAMELFSLASRLDYPPALYYLSHIHFMSLDDEGISTDPQVGIALLKRAAQLGLQEARIRLADHGEVYPHPVAAVQVPVVPAINSAQLDIQGAIEDVGRQLTDRAHRIGDMVGNGLDSLQQAFSVSSPNRKVSF